MLSGINWCGLNNIFLDMQLSLGLFVKIVWLQKIGYLNGVCQLMFGVGYNSAICFMEAYMVGL